MKSAPSHDPSENDSEAVGAEAAFVPRAMSESELPAYKSLYSRWKPGMDPSLMVPSGRTEIYFVWDRGEAIALFEGHHKFGNWGRFSEYRDRSSSDYGSVAATMVVVPERQGERIGHKLLTWFIKQAEEVGNDVVLGFPDVTEEGLSDRVRFLERHGFRWLQSLDGPPSAMELRLERESSAC